MKYKTLTLKDVIDTLVYYDLEHCRFPHNYLAEDYQIPKIRGLTLDDKKLILIDKEQSIEVVKEILIHELLHIKHYALSDLPRNMNQIEKIIQKETELTYKKIYGFKP